MVWVSACAAAGVLWLFIFSNLLPNVIVPQLMSRNDGDRSAEHSFAVRVDPRAALLQVHNQLSPTYGIAQPGFTAPSEATTAVFDIGLSLFWAMTLGAGLGSVAYGLEEAAKRKSTEHAYV
jgi:hypothetical protein